jgi:hypothetical protein
MKNVARIRLGRNPFTPFEEILDWDEACEVVRVQLRLDWRSRVARSPWVFAAVETGLLLLTQLK